MTKLERDWRRIQKAHKTFSAPDLRWGTTPTAGYAIYAVALAVQNGKDRGGRAHPAFIAEAIMELEALPKWMNKRIADGQEMMADIDPHYTRTVGTVRFFGPPTKETHMELWGEMCQLERLVEARAYVGFVKAFSAAMATADEDLPMLSGLMNAKAMFFGLPEVEQWRILGGWSPVQGRPTAAELQEEDRECGGSDSVGRFLNLHISKCQGKNELDVNAVQEFCLTDGSTQPVEVRIREGTTKSAAIAHLKAAIGKIEAEYDELVADGPGEESIHAQARRENVRKRAAWPAEAKVYEEGGVGSSLDVPMLGGVDDKAGLATAA